MTSSETKPNGNSPTHLVYHVRDRDDQKGIFTRIGAAWPHKDGKGFNLVLDCVPIDGRITLRIVEDKKD